MNTQPLNLYDYLSRGFLVLLAVLLQVQVTLFASDDYLGLRFNSADFLLPILGLIIVLSLLFKRSFWPQWQKPFGYWAPLLLTCVIGLAILNGFRIQGDWSHWAVFNKGVGWLVLMAYLALGGWISTNRHQDIRTYFILPFLSFLLAVTVFESFFRLMFYKDLRDTLSFMYLNLGYDLSGLMVNRNAFAFLYLCALVFSSVFLLKYKKLLPFEAILYKGFWLFTPLFLTFNASRTSFLILIPLALYVAIGNWRLFCFRILPLLAVGSLILPFVQNSRLGDSIMHLNTLQEQSSSYISGDADSKTLEDNVYIGDQVRVQVIRDSLSLYMQHPITGAGLGTVIEHQKTMDGRHLVAVIDNTALWVLTEMGPIGLICFGAVYICIVIALKRQSGALETYREVFCYSIIFVLIGFGVFSMLHEILYSRFLWVFLGMALALPLSKARA